jgi:hypothetical protein
MTTTNKTTSATTTVLIAAVYQVSHYFGSLWYRLDSVPRLLMWRRVNALLAASQASASRLAST